MAFDGIAVMTNPANEAVACLSFVDLYALLGGQSEGFARPGPTPTTSVPRWARTSPPTRMLR